ncbi:MAG: hypothetical protein ACREOI_15300 [bacterium]
MIVRFFIVLIAFILFAAPAKAQELSIDGIIQKYAQALGGREPWQQMHAVKLSGVLTTGGVDYPLTILNAKPNLCRLEILNEGKKVTMAYDGQAGWESNEAQSPEKKAIRDTRSKNFVEMLAIFVDALIDYKAKDYQIKSLGQEKVDSDMAYKLEVTLAPGRTEFWYIDTKSFLPSKRSAVITFREAQVVQAIYYFDYKPVAGCMIPHYLERTELHYLRGYEIRQAEINPEISKADFAPIP